MIQVLHFLWIAYKQVAARSEVLFIIGAYAASLIVLELRGEQYPVPLDFLTVFLKNERRALNLGHLPTVRRTSIST